ncbi:MAG TPA: phosphoribosyltransferase [Planctomycetota bacterium]|nr:phosphoribosyltransferase [Planctomycetota bacterium]
MIYRDRADAGRFLATKLAKYAGNPDLVVLGLPRGGVPVAYEVASALRAPLDIFAVRKLGMPGQEEFAIGAIATGGVIVLNHKVVSAANLSAAQVDSIVARERVELQRREQAYRGDRPAAELRGHTVILVDDGLATGSSMWAAVTALRKLAPARVIVAVPVGSVATCAMFNEQTDETVCARAPVPFHAVGNWYADFGQTSDDEVRELLARAAKEYQRPEVDGVKSASSANAAKS